MSYWPPPVACCGVWCSGLLMPVLRTLVQAATSRRAAGSGDGVHQTHHTLGEMLPLAIVSSLAAALGVQRVLVGTGML